MYNAIVDNREELIEILETAVLILTKNKIDCEITIVGGFAIYLNYQDFGRITYDIDIITNKKEISNYGFSIGAMDVLENFDNYHENRILLDKYSSEYVKVFVLTPSGLLKSKLISNREYPDKEDIEFLKEKLGE